MQDLLTVERFYRHPAVAVWAAISEAEAISEWFIKADFKPEPGYRYTFTHEQTVVRGEVLAVRPPSELVYTWVVGDTPTETTVKWVLTEQDGGTLLRIEHSGFSGYEGESAVTMFDASVKGWDSVINELQKYLEPELHAENQQ